MVVICTLVVGGRLEEVYEEDLLSKVKVTVAWSFPDQESLRWGDGDIIHEHMDQLHLNQRCRDLCVLHVVHSLLQRISPVKCKNLPYLAVSQFNMYSIILFDLYFLHLHNKNTVEADRKVSHPSVRVLR